jgi:hypothetical protein
MAAQDTVMADVEPPDEFDLLIASMVANEDCSWLSSLCQRWRDCAHRPAAALSLTLRPATATPQQQQPPPYDPIEDVRYYAGSFSSNEYLHTLSVHGTPEPQDRLDEVAWGLGIATTPPPPPASNNAAAPNAANDDDDDDAMEDLLAAAPSIGAITNTNTNANAANDAAARAARAGRVDANQQILPSVLRALRVLEVDNTEPILSALTERIHLRVDLPPHQFFSALRVLRLGKFLVKWVADPLPPAKDRLAPPPSFFTRDNLPNLIAFDVELLPESNGPFCFMCCDPRAAVGYPSWQPPPIQRLVVRGVKREDGAPPRVQPRGYWARGESMLCSQRSLRALKDTLLYAEVQRTWCAATKDCNKTVPFYPTADNTAPLKAYNDLRRPQLARHADLALLEYAQSTNNKFPPAHAAPMRRLVDGLGQLGKLLTLILDPHVDFAPSAVRRSRLLPHHLQWKAAQRQAAEAWRGPWERAADQLFRGLTSLQHLTLVPQHTIYNHAFPVLLPPAMRVLAPTLTRLEVLRVRLLCVGPLRELVNLRVLVLEDLSLKVPVFPADLRPLTQLASLGLSRAHADLADVIESGLPSLESLALWHPDVFRLTDAGEDDEADGDGDAEDEGEGAVGHGGRPAPIEPAVLRAVHRRMSSPRGLSFSLVTVVTERTHVPQTADDVAQMPGVQQPQPPQQTLEQLLEAARAERAAARAAAAAAALD